MSGYDGFIAQANPVLSKKQEITEILISNVVWQFYYIYKITFQHKQLLNLTDWVETIYTPYLTHSWFLVKIDLKSCI